MISIGNVVSVAAGVAYYEEAVADSRVDYYAARGEAAGVWRGAAVTTVDPQLHAHVLVASFVRRANGAWGQLYSPCSTRASKKAIAPDADMFAEWARRADAVGLSTGNIAALLDQEQVREMRWFDVETVRELLGRGERGLTAQASVRTRNRRSRARTSRRG